MLETNHIKTMNNDTAELELAPVQAGEPRMQQIATWEEFQCKAQKLKTTAETLTVTDTSDRAGMALARSTRLALKDVRVAVTHRHKALKESILVEGRRIDAGKNELLSMIEPLEARLLEQEQFAERQLARIQTETREARLAEITPFLSAMIAVDLGVMSADDYGSFLFDAKTLHSAKLERERKEKEDAEAKVKADTEERERMQLENQRLRKEACEASAKAQHERDIAAAALAKEREEVARCGREAAAKAQKEREAIAKEEAEKRAAEMAPDKDKLRKYAADIRLLAIPLIANSTSPDLMRVISEGVERFASWIEAKAQA